MILQRPVDLPAALEERFARAAARLADVDIELPPSAAKTAARVVVVSDFVLRALERHPQLLSARLAHDAPLDPESIAAQLGVAGVSDERQAMAALRRTREVEMARIAWRDLAGVADLEATLADVSLLAECLIDAALEFAAARLEPRLGRPRGADGGELPLLVLGMGKLGGAELNFSSDVDLVFLYPDGASQGSVEVDAESYYARLGQLLIKLLDQRTEDGFAYRVDMRLRPFGNSGPLAIGLAAFEAYLQEHGRDWERYAYVKARLLTGVQFASDVFDYTLTPFVYRRYLDYGVFDALRQMKRLIAQEVARKDLADNIKLGPGGIREIEFIVQAFQIVRGGRRPELRARSLLTVLPLLAGDRQLPASTVAALAAAYRYLRTVENYIQAMNDAQTHELPPDDEERARLAYALHEPTWSTFLERLRRQRAIVEAQFERVAWEAEGSRPRELDPLLVAWAAGDVAAMLEGTSLAGDEHALDLMKDLRHGGLYQRMDEAARQRLAAVVVRTLHALEGSAAAPKCFERVVPIFRAVGRRSAYLALLNENPAALDRLLKLVTDSSWLARQIAEQPMLLDELLDPRVFDTPPSREELAMLLDRATQGVAANDVETMLDSIRVFQRTAIFRIAVADRLGSLPLMKVSDRLTDTAELVLDYSLRVAWQELAAKHGKPRCGPPPRDAGFAVIGYGKLAGLELGYGSDLDLVFLHDSSGEKQETDGVPPLDNERFFGRLVQRLIHFLSIQTSSGRLYEVDTRLRPSGRSGLLVTSLEGFRHYQTHDAWVWEHQALLRSRALAGSREVCRAFEAIRHDVLVSHVDRAKLKGEVAKMRLRMRDELSLAELGSFDIKQDEGGIADIEFLVDYWVLAHSKEYPELVEFPDNIRQLEALARVGLVPEELCLRIKDAYLTLRRRVHELALDEGGRVVPEPELQSVREFVSGVWRDVFADVEGD
ncbi:MAG TPA: bifunctional [glutamate--ammonia ligase]-adenylyl-L-tyrosine phosphorylase/[glutamate--ammonia-ligase] adenylyltransferase [Gammaproteobacteria bacterium]